MGGILMNWDAGGRRGARMAFAGRLDSFRVATMLVSFDHEAAGQWDEGRGTWDLRLDWKSLDFWSWYRYIFVLSCITGYFRL